MTLKASDFKVGMTVQVKESDLGLFKSAFANKIKARLGIVIWVAKYDTRAQAKEDPCYASPVNRIQVRFQKRNGRGKVFDTMMDPEHMEILTLPETQSIEPATAGA